jgi:hypothetical protein
MKENLSFIFFAIIESNRDTIEAQDFCIYEV